ncbi:MAG: hypothetical protein GX075_10495 [Firmicutes bacterium]|nr:hypothetical protein [Bacillota bacterium]
MASIKPTSLGKVLVLIYYKDFIKESAVINEQNTAICGRVPVAEHRRGFAA